MAQVIITFKIMPTSPDENLEIIKEHALKKIAKFTGNTETRVKIEPIAFGLCSLNIICISDEKKGGTDSLEEDIKQIPGVNSVEVIDVRRAMG